MSSVTWHQLNDKSSQDYHTILDENLVKSALAISLSLDR